MVAEGDHRQVARNALRRTVDDRNLQLWLRVGPDVWVDEPADGADADPRMVTIGRRDDGEPAIAALPSNDVVAGRLSTLKDCSALLRPALVEAQLAFESHRADAAAEGESFRSRQ
ncbi:hypothetical protein [Propionibacterium cyclohexanicum]|nr:hypothetical protein [Propionibacterium cyclohexanicum]